MLALWFKVGCLTISVYLHGVYSASVFSRLCMTHVDVYNESLFFFLCRETFSSLKNLIACLLTAACWKWNFFLSGAEMWKNLQTVPELLSFSKIAFLRMFSSSCIKSQVLNRRRTAVPSRHTFMLSEKQSLLLTAGLKSQKHSEVLLTCVVFVLQSCYFGNWSPSNIQRHQTRCWNVHVCCP